jgi:hypothetical protein
MSIFLDDVTYVQKILLYNFVQANLQISKYHKLQPHIALGAALPFLNMDPSSQHAFLVSFFCISVSYHDLDEEVVEH